MPTEITTANGRLYARVSSLIDAASFGVEAPDGGLYWEVIVSQPVAYLDGWTPAEAGEDGLEPLPSDDGYDAETAAVFRMVHHRLTAAGYDYIDSGLEDDGSGEGHPDGGEYHIYRRPR